MNDCLICQRIEMIKNNINKYFVKELETGYVVIGDHQSFKGYTQFLCKEHVTESHFLDETLRQRFLYELSFVGEAVYNAFKPDKMNYELLGNGDAHIITVLASQVKAEDMDQIELLFQGFRATLITPVWFSNL